MSNLKFKISRDQAAFTSLRENNNFLWLPCPVLLLFQFSNEETGLADLDGDGCDEMDVEKPPSSSIHQLLSPCSARSPAEAFLMAGAWCSGHGDALSSERDEYNVSSRDEIFFSSHFKIWTFSKLIDALIYQDTKAPFFKKGKAFATGNVNKSSQHCGTINSHGQRCSFLLWFNSLMII